MYEICAIVRKSPILDMFFEKFLFKLKKMIKNAQAVLHYGK